MSGERVSAGGDSVIDFLYGWTAEQFAIAICRYGKPSQMNCAGALEVKRNWIRRSCGAQPGEVRLMGIKQPMDIDTALDLFHACALELAPLRGAA